jgi:hypothetical protein
MPDTRRRIIMIDQKVQGALILRAAMYWIYCLLSVSLMVLCCRVVKGPAGPFSAVATDLLKDYAPALAASLLLLPVVLVDIVRFSHRFVGPMYRLKWAMNSLAEGQPVRRVSFREGDFWIEFADSFNRVLERLQPSTESPEASTESSQPSSESPQPSSEIATSSPRGVRSLTPKVVLFRGGLPSSSPESPSSARRAQSPANEVSSSRVEAPLSHDSVPSSSRPVPSSGDGTASPFSHTESSSHIAPIATDRVQPNTNTVEPSTDGVPSSRDGKPSSTCRARSSTDVRPSSCAGDDSSPSSRPEPIADTSALPKGAQDSQKKPCSPTATLEISYSGLVDASSVPQQTTEPR